MRVAIVAEYYPRAADPVLGVWAHRQAVAAAAAGADVHVLVLHRPLPSRAALRSRSPRALVAPLRQPLRSELDGVPVSYVPFLAPPRPRSYESWGAWAAAPLALALRRLRRRFPFDLVHAHYAAPAGDAVRRARVGRPLAISVHGGDLLAVAEQSETGARAVRERARPRRGRARQLGRHGAARAALRRGQHARRAPRQRPAGRAGRRPGPARHRRAPDRAQAPRRRPARAVAAARRPSRRRVGRGRRRPRARAARAAGRGAGPGRARALHRRAAARARARGGAPRRRVRAPERRRGVRRRLRGGDGGRGPGDRLPRRGRPGGDRRRRARGSGWSRPGDPEDLARELGALLEADDWRHELGAAARATVERAFTWDACGRATVAAYEEALRA